MSNLEENMTPEQIELVRERLEQDLRGQSEQIQKLVESAQELSRQHQRLEQTAREQFEALSAGRVPQSGARLSFEKLLSSVRNLITATDAEQVFESLTEEAEQMGVRAAIFDIRGRAAWGFVARGFGKSMTAKSMRALVVPLNQENPFRRVYEIGGHVDLTASDLRRHRNVMNAFKPSAESAILLLPIRSAGSVTAIFYCDPKESGAQLPVDALKILTEFAGAQIDRLMALAGEMAPRADDVPAAESEEVTAADSAEQMAEPSGVEGSVMEPEAVQEMAQPDPSPDSQVAESAVPEPASQPETAPEVEVADGSASAPPEPVEPSQSASAPPPVLDKLPEADQKVHKDAKRFAKLLVSEIELYNKAKVAEARKNKDLYHRLKSDIDRSRQTYNKRFENSLGKQHDYFHDELVRLLAENDPSALGADYPGPAV